MNRFARITIVTAGLFSALLFSSPGFAATDPEFQDSFPAVGKLLPRGINPYFMPLIGGYKIMLEGESDGETETVLLSVLHTTRIIAGVRCAIVQEREWVDGELAEIAWNYYAISASHGSVFYFGEDVTHYEDGMVIGHEGSWRAGVNGARMSLAMPGYPVTGARYFSEIAPPDILERAELLNISATVATPAGTFHDCVMMEESSPLDPADVGFKFFAAGIGLIQDEELKLVAYGFRIRHPRCEAAE